MTDAENHNHAVHQRSSQELWQTATCGMRYPGDHTMTSRIIRPIERAMIDLSGLAADGAATVFLARRIDVSAFKHVTMYLRFHPGTVLAQTPAAANFVINADGFTAEDPGALDTMDYPAFQEPLSTTDIKTATAGTMKVVSLTDFGALLSINLYVSVAVSGTLRWVLSCDLVCNEF